MQSSVRSRMPAFLPSWPVVVAGLLAVLWPLLMPATDFLIDPARAWVHHTGEVASWLLVATLAMTPLQRLSGWPGWIRWRRAFGLLMALAASLHLLAFAGLWQGFDLLRLADETARRPYLWVGLSAWLLLLPLVFTSTQSARRRLGLRWQRLHRLVYLVAVLAIWHQAWSHKLGLFGVWVVALPLFLLLFWRALPAVRRVAGRLMNGSLAK